MLWSASADLSAIGKGLQPEAARCWICRSLASVLESHPPGKEVESPDVPFRVSLLRLAFYKTE